MNSRYILNHLYRIKDDETRAFILSTVRSKDYPEFVEKEWTSKIHPVIARVILQFSEAKQIDQAVESIVRNLNLTMADASYIVGLLLNNSERYGLKYDDMTFRIPKNLIIRESEQKVMPIRYPESFLSQSIGAAVDFKTKRCIKAPLTLVFMVTDRCVTDCVYCYADKSRKAQYMSLETIERFVSEAASLSIQKIMLDGGEVFLHPQWREILILLKKYQYDVDFISTKMPLSSEDVSFLKEQNVSLQISLDAVCAADLSRILNVSRCYRDKILPFILQLDKQGLDYQISTVLTKFNSNARVLGEIYDFVSSLSCIKRWQIRPAFRSLYSKEDFDDIKASETDFVEVEKIIKSLQEKSGVKINWAGVSDAKYFSCDKGSEYFVGPRCSANVSNLFILPDGKVTVCEQLYWSPYFIIGDLNVQGIEEIWKSDKSLSLAYPKRSDFTESSNCKRCKIFDECIGFSNRCYADIIKAYGWEHRDYPDPRCCFAPCFTHELRT